MTRVGADAAPHQFGQDVGGIAEQRDGDGFAPRCVFGDQPQCVVEVFCLLVDVAGAQTEVDARLLALDVERGGTGHGGGERLGAPMPPRPAVSTHLPFRLPLKCWRPASTKVS